MVLSCWLGLNHNTPQTSKKNAVHWHSAAGEGREVFACTTLQVVMSTFMQGSETFSKMLTYQADTQTMWKYLYKSLTFSSVKAIKNVRLYIMVKWPLLPTVLIRNTLLDLHGWGYALPNIFGNELELSFILAKSNLKCYFKILLCVCHATASFISCHYTYLQ